MIRACEQHALSAASRCHGVLQECLEWQPCVQPVLCARSDINRSEPTCVDWGMQLMLHCIPEPREALSLPTSVRFKTCQHAMAMLWPVDLHPHSLACKFTLVKL